MILNLEQLARDFVNREVLEQAREVQFPKILKAMQLASAETLRLSNRDLEALHEQIKQAREHGNRPQ